MPTIQQLIKKARARKQIGSRSPALEKAPQKRGVCVRVYVRNPKKPNSAKRKVTNILLAGRSGTRIIGYIPGESSALQEHSVVLVRGGRVKDLPGVKYHLICGVFDFKYTKKRGSKRSKYGVRRTS